MECYIPHWVEYRVFNYEGSGEKTPAQALYKSTDLGALSTYALVPSYVTWDCTYGFEERRYMVVYYSTGNAVRDLYPVYVMTAILKQS